VPALKGPPGNTLQIYNPFPLHLHKRKQTPEKLHARHMGSGGLCLIAWRGEGGEPFQQGEGGKAREVNVSKRCRSTPGRGNTKTNLLSLLRGILNCLLVSFFGRKAVGRRRGKTVSGWGKGISSFGPQLGLRTAEVEGEEEREELADEEEEWTGCEEPSFFGGEKAAMSAQKGRGGRGPFGCRKGFLPTVVP